MTNSFECILFGDGAILLQYKDMDPTHLSWSTESIGWEDGTGMYGTQISFGVIPEPETAYWIPACAHTLPQEGGGNCLQPIVWEAEELKPTSAPDGGLTYAATPKPPRYRTPKAAAARPRTSTTTASTALGAEGSAGREIFCF